MAGAGLALSATSNCRGSDAAGAAVSAAHALGDASSNPPATILQVLLAAMLPLRIVISKRISHQTGRLCKGLAIPAKFPQAASSLLFHELWRSRHVLRVPAYGAIGDMLSAAVSGNNLQNTVTLAPLPQFRRVSSRGRDLRPGPRRANRLPRTRSRPVTNLLPCSCPPIWRLDRQLRAQKFYSFVAPLSFLTIRLETFTGSKSASVRLVRQDKSVSFQRASGVPISPPLSPLSARMMP